MTKLIESADAKLPGIWLNLHSAIIRAYFEEKEMNIYKIFDYPGGKFVVFTDEADTLSLKLQFHEKELLHDMLNWSVIKITKDGGIIGYKGFTGRHVSEVCEDPV